MSEQFTIQPESFDSPEAQQALAQYVAELVERFPEGFRSGSGHCARWRRFHAPEGRVPAGAGRRFGAGVRWGADHA
ncbi:hypothetical protein [Saccharopolyspora dendranthemae]|uniref:hypothetical protein n=1 Tax=Saccharopolyspora dendranthemae TaxID=1181886 RepID=UPI001FE6397A|nr:hypothetical protein [Saccharopolyspora dendranthemae]